MDIGSGSGAIVKCFNCEAVVRIFATESISTSVSSETFSLERWCFSCLSSVEESTAEVMKYFSEFPNGLPLWDSDEEQKLDNDNDNDKDKD